ncbi:MAG: ATP-binding protein, partial [Gemmatimonadota bacterium]|nr:ATP-binding protein [Gemmatimonadota bacterium]
DLLSTVAYCNHYFGQCPAWIEETAIERRPALYLLADIDVPWTADGIRDRGDKRELMHELFVQTLTRLQAPFQIVSGVGDPRMSCAVDLVDALLARVAAHEARSATSIPLDEYR